MSEQTQQASSASSIKARSSLSPLLECANQQKIQGLPCAYLFRIVGVFGITLAVFFCFFDALCVESTALLYFDIAECCIWVILLIGGHFKPAAINPMFLVMCVIKALHAVHVYLPKLEETYTEKDSFILSIYSFIYFTLVVLSSLVIKNIYLRFMALNVSIIYFLVYVLFFCIGNNADVIGVGALISLCAVNMSMYLNEIVRKLVISEQGYLLKQIDGWRTLLYEVFPLGVVIAKYSLDEKSFDVLCSNQICQEILKNTASQFLDEELKRIFVDSPKSRSAQGYHSPPKKSR